MDIRRNVPLGLLYPLRQGAVRLRRGHPVRSACVAALKYFEKGRRIFSELTEIRPLDRPDLSFEPVDSMVTDAVYWVGIQGYEGILSDVWTELCRNASGILEIGGNIGFYTVLGGQVAPGRYTVVEPLPQVAAILSANLRRNRIGGVEIREAAAIPDPTPRDITINVPREGRAVPVGSHVIEGSEVAGRSSLAVITVPGLPVADLAQGMDLIKIDAEGLEAALLEAIRDQIVTRRPTLVIEVLPQSVRLAQLLAELARTAGYRIHVVPAYGSNRIQTVAPEEFHADVPSRFNSKDVVLSVAPLVAGRT